MTAESDSDFSEGIWSEDEDRFCGDPEWEFSLAAVARRKLYAEAMIKEGEEEAALVHIRFLFEDEEEEEEEEPCVTCKPNWDWERYDSDNSYGSDSATDSE